MSRRLAGVFIVLTLLAGACTPDRIVVASGTTLSDSGFIDQLIDRYRTATGNRVAAVGESSARALALLSGGGVDLSITHAPPLEAEFLAAHPAATAVPVFASRFLLVGPASLTAEVDGMSLAAALQRIASARWAFVSRGDGSGTHGAELAGWEAAGIDPTNLADYAETGLGMGQTLQVADQRGAFTLTEEGAFVAASTIDLAVVSLTDADLPNVYTATLLPGDRLDEAAEFVDWVTSSQGKQAVAEVAAALFGREVYQPIPAVRSQPAANP